MGSGRLRVLGVVAAAVLIVGCASSAPDSLLERTSRFDDAIELAAPVATGSTPLERALSERRSGREFSSEEVPISSIGQLFWAGQGITDNAGYRTAPSAGALYPIELYAVTATAVIHYLPDGHRIEERRNAETLGQLSAAAFGQDFVSSAPVVLVITGVSARTEAKYGAVARDLMNREAGHVAQNILLQATSLELQAVPVGGFDPESVAPLLALAPAEEVLYLIPIGHP